MRAPDKSLSPFITIFYIVSRDNSDLFYSYLIYKVGEMGQKQLRKTSKHILVVIISPLFTRVPITESRQQFVATRLLLQCNTAFLGPLVDCINQHFLNAICLCYLPSGNTCTFSMPFVSATCQVAIPLPLASTFSDILLNISCFNLATLGVCIM